MCQLSAGGIADSCQLVPAGSAGRQRNERVHSRVCDLAGITLGWALHDRYRRVVTSRCRFPPYDHLACHLREARSGGITAVDKPRKCNRLLNGNNAPDGEAEGH